jgi:hypothetical protein
MSRPARPKVLTQGARSFIEVPSDSARSLHAYLLGQYVVCSPPDPCYTGLEVIELGHSTDVRAVRTLLKNWA